ncbi:MAG TPA: peptidoglycan editing factor PgeF [bacterium]|nr:peptidoglycan editing factor PgeF [bacterium]HPN29700.1 peptidoglycan editing factor PgeF [bacterium]
MKDLKKISYNGNCRFFNAGGVIAGFTTRRGGVSASPFNEWNFGFHTGDSKNSVIKNRTVLANQLHINPLNMAFMNQTHSSNIKFISEKDCSPADGMGFYGIESAFDDTDALITNNKNILLCVMTADCCPVLIFDGYNNTAAAIHGGWKGTADRITETVLKKMDVLFKTVKYDKLKAFLGPCICSECYEVDSGFIKNIELNYRDLIDYLAKKNGCYYFDIKKIIIDGLKKFGVGESNIIDSEICSFESSEEYYSYRKNKITGRFVSFIKIDGK